MFKSQLRPFFHFLLFLVDGSIGFAAKPNPIRGGGPGVPSPTPSPSGRQVSAPAAIIDEKLFNGMQWRQIGPFRGGRALTIEGIPGEPGTYYFGAVAGGVWKTIDGGANWTPLFDKEDISSIGALAVAPSDHNVIYAGTGKQPFAGTRPTVWAFTNRSMPAKRGQMLGCGTRTTSARSLSILTMRMWR